MAANIHAIGGKQSLQNEGIDSIWWQRSCLTAVRRGSDAPTNFKMMQYQNERKSSETPAFLRRQRDKTSGYWKRQVHHLRFNPFTPNTSWCQ